MSQRTTNPFCRWTSWLSIKPVLPAYRPEVDGLRAIAVSLVLAYHLGVRQVTGGFVGVDVFFVISGFLITSQLVNQLQTESFSLQAFYIRRIHRLFPALFVMLVATMTAGFWILYPATYVELGKSVIATVLSVSNIFFWFHSDYFDAPANTRPLLHTWSLGVEEQFYLLFPALLMLMWKGSRARIIVLLSTAALLSLSASAIGAFKFPSAAFYLLPTRLWELLVGSMLAFGFFLRTSSRAGRNFMGISGLILIIGSAILIDGETRFPGAVALLPCVGAALVISAGLNGSHVVGRLLSLRPVVFLGLVSYSLYLWHWPTIILYQNYYGLTWLDPASKIIVGSVSLLLAVLSWRYVERPFRTASQAATGPRAIRGSALCASAAIAISAPVVMADGIPARFDPEVIRIASFLDYKPESPTASTSCFLRTKGTQTTFDKGRCLSTDPTRKNVLVLGDSHSDHLIYGLKREWTEFHFLQASAPGCRPTLEHEFSADSRCSGLMKSIYEEYLARERPDLVLLSGRWRSSDMERLKDTLRWLRERRFAVVVSGPTVEYGGAVPQLLALSVQDDNPGLPDAMVKRSIAEVDDQLAALVRGQGAAYFSPFRVFCPIGFDCEQLAHNGVPYQFDYGHLTREGSLRVARQMIDQGLHLHTVKDAASPADSSRF